MIYSPGSVLFRSFLIDLVDHEEAPSFDLNIHPDLQVREISWIYREIYSPIDPLRWYEDLH